MARTKATVRKMPDNTKRLPADFIKRTVYPFKTKQTLPAQKTVNITKNGQIVSYCIVNHQCKKKIKYFSGKNRLIY